MTEQFSVQEVSSHLNGFLTVWILNAFHALDSRKFYKIIPEPAGLSTTSNNYAPQSVIL
jgi:hypothetical protein